MSKIKQIFMFLAVLILAAGCMQKKDSGKEPDNAKTVHGLSKAELLADPRVRQAINYAIDMPALIDGLMSGKAVPADALMPNGSWKAEGLNSYAYNPDKARELLAEAGWNRDYVLDVVYYYGDQMTVDLMAAVQQYLADVGIKMVPRKLEGDLASQLWVPPVDPVNGPSAVKWDMAYAAVAALAPHEYYGKFSPGGGNSHTPSTPELEALLRPVYLTVDVQQQKEYFKALQRYENETQIVIPLYYQPVFVVQNVNLDRKGAEYGNEQYNYDWNIVEWDIKPGKDGRKIMRTNGGPVEFFETPMVNPGLFMSTKVLFDHLLVADGSIAPKKGQLASSYDVSADGKIITFILRTDANWHDGEKITSLDVKKTYELAAKVIPIHSVFMDTLKSLEGHDEYVSGKSDEISGIIIDGNKIIFKFSRMDPNALLTFTQLPPLPVKYFENVDPLKFQQSSFWQSPVGSGPFKVKEVKMGDYAVFERFDSYYGGISVIDEIRMYPSGESDPNLVKNVSAGNIDYAYSKSTDDVLSVENLDNIIIIPVDVRYTRLFYINKFPRQ